MQARRKGREADKDGKNYWNGKFIECCKPRNTKLRNGKISWLLLLEINGRGFSGPSFLQFSKLPYVHSGIAHFDFSEIKVWVFFSLPFKLTFKTGFFFKPFYFFSLTHPFISYSSTFPPPPSFLLRRSLQVFLSYTLNTLVESLWWQNSRWKKKSRGAGMGWWWWYKGRLMCGKTNLRWFSDLSGEPDVLIASQTSYLFSNLTCKYFFCFLTAFSSPIHLPVVAFGWLRWEKTKQNRSSWIWFFSPLFLSFSFLNKDMRVI